MTLELSLEDIERYAEKHGWLLGNIVEATDAQWAIYKYVTPSGNIVKFHVEKECTWLKEK